MPLKRLHWSRGAVESFVRRLAFLAVPRLLVALHTLSLKGRSQHKVFSISEQLKTSFPISNKKLFDEIKANGNGVVSGLWRG
jgi:hypothetical protein